MIKLLALDMDGTLLNEAKEIPQAHITAIHQAIEKGVKLVLCTGRPLFGVLPYYKKLGLDLQNEYVIVNNGCSTHQTSDWGLVDWQELSPADIEYLYDLAEKSDVQLTLFDEEHYFVLGGKPTEIVQNDAKLVFSDLTEISLEEATSGKYRMFQGMFLGTESQTDDFEERFAEELCQRFSGVRSQPVIYEAMPLGTTKATALSRLAEILKIDSSEIMAMGDANNDIEMLQFAGLGIAMGNASDHVRKNKAEDSKPDEDKEHDEVSEPTRPESNEKENHAGLNPSVDNLYKPSTDEDETEGVANDTTDEAEVPQVETEKVEAKLKEVEALLDTVTDASLKDNVTESLSGLRNNLNLQTMDNNGIMAEAEKLLALLKGSNPSPINKEKTN